MILGNDHAGSMPIEFHRELHPAGENLLVPSDSLRQALAWWVAAELIRRNPDLLRITETNPHQYGSALTIFRRRPQGFLDPELLLFLTLDKACHITPTGDWSERFNWLEVLLAENRRQYVVKQLERLLNLPTPVTTPATVHSSIGPRVIAAWLSRRALSNSDWAWTNGFYTDDDDAFVQQHLFDAMPAVSNDLDRQVPELNAHGRPESRYWFLHSASAGTMGKPVAAVDVVGGRSFSLKGASDLLQIYRAKQSNIQAVVGFALPD